MGERAYPFLILWSMLLTEKRDPLLEIFLRLLEEKASNLVTSLHLTAQINQIIQTHQRSDPNRG